MQNLAVFRFGNGLFEPIWNRRYVDSVQITVAETVGVEGRGEFYDQTGALRDIVQNHVLQLLAMFAMEPPVEFGPEDLRDEKLKVLRAVEADGAERRRARTWCAASTSPAGSRASRCPSLPRRAEVAPDSETETFVALKLDDRLLALGGRAVLPAHRQGAAEPGDEIAVQFKSRAAGALRRAPASPRSTRTSWPSASSPTRASCCASAPRCPGRGCRSAA